MLFCIIVTLCFVAPLSESDGDSYIDLIDVEYHVESKAISFDGTTSFDTVDLLLIGNGWRSAVKTFHSDQGRFEGTFELDEPLGEGIYNLVAVHNNYYDREVFSVDGYVTIHEVKYDKISNVLAWNGYTTADTLILQILDSEGKILGQAYSTPTRGVYSGRMSAVLTGEEYDLAVFDSGNSKLCDEASFYTSEIEISLSRDSIVLYPGSDDKVGITVAGCSMSDLIITVDRPEVVRAELTGGMIIVKAQAIGEATIQISHGGHSAYLTVSVNERPAVATLKTYNFFIQITKDFDKATYGPYSEDALRSGITISAEAYNAEEALIKACRENGIQISVYSGQSGGQDLKGWINSMFGLKQYQGPEDMSLWTYWAQYKDGIYNQLTLGYFTDGGDFQIIWKTTKDDGTDPSGGGGTGGGKSDDQKTSITDDGGFKTETNSSAKNEDGSTTNTNKVTTEGPDGSVSEVETKTDISADGSTTTTKTTTTNTDSEGNQTKSESVTVIEKIKDAEGNDAERKTVTEKDEDGNVKQSVSDITTSKDGTVTEKTKGTETKKDGSTVDSSTTTETKKDGSVYSETTSTVKDANGNVTGTTKSETTTEKISGGTKSSTTETSHDKDGNITGMKEIEETKTESGTKVVERSKDADGNVTGSSEKTVETRAKGNSSVTTTTEVSKDADGNAVSSTETKEKVENKPIAGGKTQTTTTTDSKTTDSSGNVTERSEESRTTITNKDGDVERSETTKVVKDQNGTTVEEVRTNTSTTKDSNDNTVRKTEYTKTTPEGKTSVDSESVSKKIDNGFQTDSTKTTVVKDKDGKVIDETKVIKTGKNTETDTEKKSSSSTETIRNGVSETKESSTVESKEVSGLKSSVEVEKKGDSIIKAESVTTLPTKDGNVDADSVQKAIDQSSAAMKEVSVDNKEISKTIEVKNDSGASVTVSPEAIGKISEHGAGLKVGSDNESIHVDDKVVENLSGNADKDVKLEMDKNTHDDLNDKQKQIVGGRQFIVLGAFVGDSRIHELGGVATVVFGYELRDGDDPSRLCVWYVDDNGVKTKMTASYDQSTGRFTMETTYFSVFMVASEDEPVPTPDDSEDSDDSGNGSDTMLYVGIAAIVIVIIAAVAAIHRRKA